MKRSFRTVCILCLLAPVAARFTPELFAQAPTAVPGPPAAAQPSPALEPAAIPEAAPTPALPKAATRSGRTGPSYGFSFGGAGGAGGAGGFIADSPGGGFLAGNSGYRTGSRREPTPPVIVEFTRSDVAARQELEEDLSVMSHVLDQALERGLGEEAPTSKMGVPLLFTGNNRAARALYLEGFGALFMIKVNMPLLAPAPVMAEKPAKSVDSEWESARREVLGSEDKGDLLGAPGSETPFDAEQVEALKHTLTTALRNAANIRGLQPEEYVSVAVFGAPVPRSAGASTTMKSGADSQMHVEQSVEEGASANKSSATSSKPGKSKRTTASAGKIIVMSTSTESNSAKGSVLTLRAKKADITDLADGTIQPDEFAKRVKTQAYVGNGSGVSSVNTWIQSGPRRPEQKF